MFVTNLIYMSSLYTKLVHFFADVNCLSRLPFENNNSLRRFNLLARIYLFVNRFLSTRLSRPDRVSVIRQVTSLVSGLFMNSSKQVSCYKVSQGNPCLRSDMVGCGHCSSSWSVFSTFLLKGYSVQRSI